MSPARAARIVLLVLTVGMVVGSILFSTERVELPDAVFAAPAWLLAFIAVCCIVGIPLGWLLLWALETVFPDRPTGSAYRLCPTCAKFFPSGFDRCPHCARARAATPLPRNVHPWRTGGGR